MQSTIKITIINNRQNQTEVNTTAIKLLEKIVERSFDDPEIIIDKLNNFEIQAFVSSPDRDWLDAVC